MIGNLVNLCCSRAKGDLAPALMLGAPVIPSVVLLFALWSSPESPRYYLRGGRGKYQPEKALKMLLKLRAGDDKEGEEKGKVGTISLILPQREMEQHANAHR